jgi:hypothetical protein
VLWLGHCFCYHAFLTFTKTDSSIVMQEDTPVMALHTTSGVKSLSYEPSRPIPLPAYHVRRTRSELFMLEAEALDLCMRHRIGSARGKKLDCSGADRCLPKEEINGGKIQTFNEPQSKHMKGNLKKNLEEAKVVSSDDVLGSGSHLYETTVTKDGWNEDYSEEDEMFIFDF